DLRILAAQEVVVHTETGNLIGVIGAKPPHLEKGEEAKQIPDISEIFIDIGMSTQQAEKLVALGDRVTINSKFNQLLNDRVSCKSLDDRAGVCAILEALRLIKGKKISYNVAINFSSQEETGSAGAKISSYKIKPDKAIVVDVSFAKVSGENEHKCGKMGEGVMIGYAATLNHNMSNEMKNIAKSKKIPYQIEVMGGSTGTNADEIGISRSGVMAVTLSIPQAYMHTPIEVCQISDIKAVADLIAEYLQSEEN
ncbi:MAG: M20/M25/M40 family metallo-hydrolase, partial [Oscillospiraceae bacterium]